MDKLKIGSVLKRKLDSAIGLCVCTNTPYAIFEDGTQNYLLFRSSEGRRTEDSFKDDYEIIGNAKEESLNNFVFSPPTATNLLTLFKKGKFDSVLIRKEIEFLFENKKIQDIIIS